MLSSTMLRYVCSNAATSLFQSLFRPPLNSDKTSKQLDNTQHTHPYETHSASHILSQIRV